MLLWNKKGMPKINYRERIMLSKVAIPIFFIIYGIHSAIVGYRNLTRKKPVFHINAHIELHILKIRYGNEPYERRKGSLLVAHKNKMIMWYTLIVGIFSTFLGFYLLIFDI
jgi:hypothetical protein